MKHLLVFIATLFTMTAFATDYSCEASSGSTETLELINNSLNLSGKSYELTENIAYGTSDIFIVNIGHSGFALIDINLSKVKEVILMGQTYHPAYINVNFFGVPGTHIESKTDYFCRKL